MTLPRKQLISITETPYYHIVSRCVRKAYLCGNDPFTKRSYEHRRQWIVDRIQHLTQIFNIEICAYAVMTNHYHLVVKIRSTANWDDLQVLDNWGLLCSLSHTCQRYLEGEKLSAFELKLVKVQVKIYRERLMSISWFMKLLNQHIATIANKEDKCTGHFWEGRFKSQALLDKRALLTCMAYVDLNPIRSALALTPEDSDYTSVKERIRSNAAWLSHFGHTSKDIPYCLSDYLNLVDYTGRAILKNKRGFIPGDLPAILDRLKVQPDSWLEEINQFSSKGITAVGTIEQLKAFCDKVGKKWNIGLKLTPAPE